MRYHTALISTVFLCLNFMANAWQPAGNRLMTYDRKVVKVDEKRVRESNKALINSLVQKHQ